MAGHPTLLVLLVLATTLGAGCLSTPSDQAPPGQAEDGGDPPWWEDLEPTGPPEQVAPAEPLWRVDFPAGVHGIHAPDGGEAIAVSSAYGPGHRTVLRLYDPADGSLLANHTYGWFSCCAFPPVYVDPGTGTGIAAGFNLTAVPTNTETPLAGLDYRFQHPRGKYDEEALVIDGPTGTGGFAVASWENTHLYLFEPDLAEPVLVEDLAGMWGTVDVSRDGTRVVAATHSNAYLVQSDPPRVLVNRSLGGEARGFVLNGAAVADDGPRWAVLEREGNDTRVLVLDGEDPEPVATVEVGTTSSGELWLPGPGQVLVADLGRGGLLFNATTGAPLAWLEEGHAVQDVEARDGRLWILSGSQNGRTLSLWTSELDGHGLERVWTGQVQRPLLHARLLGEGVVTVEWNVFEEGVAWSERTTWLASYPGAPNPSAPDGSASSSPRSVPGPRP